LIPQTKGIDQTTTTFDAEAFPLNIYIELPKGLHCGFELELLTVLHCGFELNTLGIVVNQMN